MLLPRGDDYDIAVQNPRIAFTDSDLKNSSVETTPLGLPKPYSGGFTTTYKLSNHQTSWAVRCFHRDIQDLQKRYQSIGNFFSKNSSQYFVNAIYLAEGIKINGKGYPIIKMQWLEGEPLNIYLDRWYNLKAKVEKLLSDFTHLVNELEKSGIAHGDLQHGNIIVKNDRLHLIDYDGMYFPELASLKANEIGHINYQHPKRSSSHYNQYIDRFSSIVIYIGLKAISISPNLWKKYENGENILFRNQDYANLQQSQLIKDLMVIPDLKLLVERLIGCCYLEFEKVPSLSDFLSGNFSYNKNAIGVINITRSQYQIIDASQSESILEHFGEKVEVVGKIVSIKLGYTDFNDQYYFINFTNLWPNQTFTLVLWKEGIESFKNGNKSITGLKNQWVSVTGVVSKFRSKPQIIVEQNSQIQILSNRDEADQLLKQKHSIKPIQPIRQVQKPIDKEVEVFNTIYKNKQANIPPSPKPTVTQTSKNITTQAKTAYSNSSKPIKTAPVSNNGNNNNGCIAPLICAFLGAILIGSASDGKLWFVGVIGGGLLGVWINGFFK